MNFETILFSVLVLFSVLISGLSTIVFELSVAKLENVNNTVTSLLDELERQDNNDDDVIEFDYDKEQRKQEIKKLRKQGINDLLDEIEGGKDGTR